GHAQEYQREQAAMPERARVASWKRPGGSQTTGEERRECHVTGPSASNTTPFENRIVAAFGRNGSVRSDRRGCVSQRSRKREGIAADPERGLPYLAGRASGPEPPNL